MTRDGRCLVIGRGGRSCARRRIVNRESSTEAIDRARIVNHR
jgi:hypothetical protein